jgi:hypothetical protein
MSDRLSNFVTAVYALFQLFCNLSSYDNKSFLRASYWISLSKSLRAPFRVLRQSIYDESLQKLKELKLSGEIEIDEALFGGHREGKRG